MKINAYDWEKEWRENISDTAERSGIDYWNKRAEDYNDAIVNSDYENGRNAKEILIREGIVHDGIEVLDIAAGPGTITIPFAESVKCVTAIEPTENMRRYLKENANKNRLTNIEILGIRLQEMDDIANESRYDLVVCSHGLFHFPDIVRQLMRINSLSKDYCCIIEGVNNRNGYGDIYKKLGLDSAPVQYDHFIALYNILYNKGVFPEVKIFDSITKRSKESALSLWAKFLGKYRPPGKPDLEIIQRHVDENVVDGMYRKAGKMAIIYWKKVKF